MDGFRRVVVWGGFFSRMGFKRAIAFGTVSSPRQTLENSSEMIVWIFPQFEQKGVGLLKSTASNIRLLLAGILLPKKNGESATSIKAGWATPVAAIFRAPSLPVMNLTNFHAHFLFRDFRVIP